MKFLTPLIPKPWSRVYKLGPGLVPGQLLRAKAHNINNYAMPYKSDMFDIKTNEFIDSINFVMIEN